MDIEQEVNQAVQAEIIMPVLETVVNEVLNDIKQEKKLQIEQEQSAMVTTDDTDDTEMVLSQIDEQSKTLDIDDLAEDFFDDFNNKDFLAGLDVVDAWEGDETDEIKESASDKDVETFQANENEDRDVISPFEKKENPKSEGELSGDDISKNISVKTESNQENSEEIKEELHEIDSNDDNVKLNEEKHAENLKSEENQSPGKEKASSEEIKVSKSENNEKPINNQAENEEVSKVDTFKHYTIPKKRPNSRPRDENTRNTRANRDVLKPTNFRSRKPSDDDRRDPDKVKRDIQRDKARCEKERIVEKLRIVETGLVPPGTEMDTDVPKVSKSSPPTTASATTATRRSKDKHSSRDSRETKPPPTRSTKRHYSRSPSPPSYRRKRPHSRSRSPIMSHSIHSKKRYSPDLSSYRCRTRSRSPLAASTTRYDTRETRDARESRRKRYRSRSISPSRRYPKHLSSERHKSRSPDRKQSFLEELDRKLARIDRDQLKNIKAKLNGDSYPNPAHMAQQSLMPMTPYDPMHSMGMVGMQPQIMPVHAPQMVPAPGMIDPYSGGAAYDQSFFIGADSNSYNMGYAQGYAGYDQGYGLAGTSQGLGVDSYENSDFKLFKDDSISLTEYLKLTRRSDKNQQISLSHKVKVLNRCQDALTVISGLQQSTGRFYCKVERCLQGAQQKNPDPVERSTSPLRANRINLDFTTQRRETKQKQTTSLQRLMTRLGVKEKTVNIKIPATQPGKEVTFEETSTQTSEYQCDKCTKRENIQRVDVGVQCTPDTLEFSAQVTEDDFLSTARNALKHLLKHQSFASLTPAQILAQLGENKDKKPAAVDERSERFQEFVERDWRPQQAQEFERRDRASDFERRTDWSLNSSPQKTPYSEQARPMNPQINPPQFSGMLGVGLRPIMGGNAPRPLMTVRPIRTPGPGGPRPGPMYRGQQPNQFPNAPFGNNMNYGPNTMGNYPMRRFN